MFDWILKLIVSKVKDYVFRNWKTTLVGVLGAALAQVPALAAYKDQLIPVVIGLIGLIAKDGDKTGTTEKPRLDVPAPAPAPADAEWPSEAAKDVAAGG